jgi:hypothetical protein
MPYTLTTEGDSSPGRGAEETQGEAAQAVGRRGTLRPLLGATICGKGAAAQRWGTPQGCPVPWHASSAESCPQAGFRQRAFCWFFSCFLVFRARARTARKALSGAGLRRFLSYPNSPFFGLAVPFFGSMSLFSGGIHN